MRTTFAIALVTTALVACSSGPKPTSAEPPPQDAQPDMPAPEPAAPPASDAAASGATPSAEVAPAPAPPPEPAADLAVVPMKVTVDAKTTMELKADKGVYFKGKKIATFEKNVLQIVDMKDNMSVMKDGSVVSTPAMPKKIKFNDKDELEIEGGGKIVIDDKGVVTMVPPDGKEAPKDVKPKITGFKPEARRSATLVLLMAMMSMGTEAKPAPASSSAPPSSVPPAAKK